MGQGSSSHLSSSVPKFVPPTITVPVCDAECQKKKEINKAEETYSESKTDLKEATTKNRQAWVELNTLKKGPEWIRNNDERKNNYGLLNLYENKRKEIEILSKNYNDNLEILHNQLLVTNNQYEKISKLDSFLQHNLIELSSKKHIYSTNLRKLKYEKEKYHSFSSNISNLSKSFISCLIIYICLLFTYNILERYNFKIGLIRPIEFPKFQNPISQMGRLPGLNIPS